MGLKWTRSSKTKGSESFAAVNRLNSKEKDTYQNMKHGVLEAKVGCQFEIKGV